MKIKDFQKNLSVLLNSWNTYFLLKCFKTFVTFVVLY